MPVGTNDPLIYNTTGSATSSTYSQMTFCASCGVWYAEWHTCTPSAMSIGTAQRLSDEEVDRIARRIVKLLKEDRAKETEGGA